MASAGNLTATVTVSPSIITDTTMMSFERRLDDIYLNGFQRTIYIAEKPPVKEIDLGAAHDWLERPRPPARIGILVWDRDNSEWLPLDWNPKAHAVETGKWTNRTAFFGEAGFGRYARIPVVPHLDEAY